MVLVKPTFTSEQQLREKSKWVLSLYKNSPYEIDGIVYMPNIILDRTFQQKIPDIYRWKKYFTAEALIKFERDQEGMISIWS